MKDYSLYVNNAYLFTGLILVATLAFVTYKFFKAKNNYQKSKPAK